MEARTINYLRLLRYHTIFSQRQFLQRDHLRNQQSHKLPKILLRQNGYLFSLTSHNTLPPLLLQVEKKYLKQYNEMVYHPTFPQFSLDILLARNQPTDNTIGEDVPFSLNSQSLSPQLSTYLAFQNNFQSHHRYFSQLLLRELLLLLAQYKNDSLPPLNLRHFFDIVVFLIFQILFLFCLLFLNRT